MSVCVNNYISICKIAYYHVFVFLDMHSSAMKFFESNFEDHIDTIID